MQQAPPPAFRWTARKQRFVDEYLISGNGTEAAKAAGFAEGSANRTAYKLLRIPEVRAEVERRQDERAKQAKITAEEILYGLSMIARGQPVDPKTGAQLSLDLKVRDANKAYELLMRHLGMLRDIVQVTTPIPVQLYMPDNSRTTDASSGA